MQSLIKRTWRYFLWIVQVALSVACTKQKVVKLQGATKPLITLIQSNASYTIFFEALKRTGYAQVISGSGPFTVLVPDDSAFQNAHVSSVLDIDTMNLDRLKRFVACHIIPRGVHYSDVANVLNQPFPTLDCSMVYFSKNINPPQYSFPTLHVNGRTVKYGDIEASNGVIHVIDSTLNVSQGSVQAFLNSDANYSVFVAALKKFDLWDSLAAKGGPITVFAPTNQALAFSHIRLNNIQKYDTGRLHKYFFSSYLLYNTRLFLSNLADAPPPSGPLGFTNANVAYLESNFLLAIFIGPYAFQVWDISGNNFLGYTDANGTQYAATPVAPDNNESNGVVHVVNHILVSLDSAKIQ